MNARRLDSFLDLRIFTRTAGFTARNPWRTASPMGIRNTLMPKFAVERDSSFASLSRKRAMSLACSVERSRLLFDDREQDLSLVLKTRKPIITSDFGIKTMPCNSIGKG